MAKTSFHLTPCDIESSELHNKRLRKLDYVKKELTPLNEAYYYTDRTLKAELKRIRADVKAKTGRALQKNAIPIKEGVAVIGIDTTMGELKEFCRRCQDEFGVVPLQIYIHKDEGHKGSKIWTPNLHAHIIWRMYGEDGRNVRISNIDCARMQTILAECLGMERGESSGRKHLSALEYKKARREEELKELDQEMAKLNTAKAVREQAIESAKEGVKEFFTGKKQAEIDRLTAKVREKEEEVAATRKQAETGLKRTKDDFNRRITSLENAITRESRRADAAKAEARENAKKYTEIIDSFWPGAMEAIHAIVERCTTTARAFTMEQVMAIRRALAVYTNREYAISKLWEAARKLFPTNTYKEWIQEGKEDYLRIARADDSKASLEQDTGIRR